MWRAGAYERGVSADVAAYVELLTHRHGQPKDVRNDERFDEVIVVRDIPIRSFSMHDVLLFYGVVPLVFCRQNATQSVGATRAGPRWPAPGRSS
jgi:GTP cyclohydrolase I